MKPPRDTSAWLTAGRRVWRSIAPAGLRRSAQPLVLGVMEQRIRAALRRGEGGAAPGPLIVSGLLSEAKGISEGARLSLAAFQMAGFQPIAHDLRPVFSGTNTRLPTNQSGGAWLMHVNAPEATHTLARINSEAWLGRFRIGYWAYELARVPRMWVRAASAFHEIWAPSRFVADALRESGVETPIRLMPHPVALGAKAAAADRKAFGIPEDAFAVLAMGDLNSSATRKNLSGAIEIYLRAFPAAGAARLIVKVREEGAHPAFLARAKQMVSARPDVVFITGDLSSADLRRLVASSSLVLSPHRSEGFGLSLAEAFLAGVPTLATGWSGNLDFMRDLPELLIDFSLVPVNDPYGVYRERNQVWAEPDLADGAAKLLKLAGAPELRRELAMRGCKAVQALNASWSREALMETAVGRLSQTS
jgi:glycosyltransferase involved in cell wall biosynthesis